MSHGHFKINGMLNLMCDRLSVSIDPHKSGVLREKINFGEICENNVLLEVHNLFVFCLTNKVQIKYYIP